MAVAWIKDRDAFDLEEWPKPDETTDELQAFSQSLIDRDDIDDNERKAIESLWIFLKTGTFYAWIKPEGKHVSSVNPSFWQTERPFIRDDCQPLRVTDAVNFNPFPSRIPGVRIDGPLLKSLYEESDGLFHPAFKSPKRPEGDGFMPLYEAVFWIASEGHSCKFDPTDGDIWRNAFNDLKDKILSRKLVVEARDATKLGQGTSTIERGEFDGMEPVFWFEFEKWVEAQYTRDPDEKLYRSCLLEPPANDLRVKEQEFEDEILIRGHVRWTRLQVERSVVARLWPEISKQSGSVVTLSNSDTTNPPPPSLSSFDPMKQSHWSLVMTIAWIVWRTEAAVREHWNDWRVASGRNDVSSLALSLSGAFDTAGLDDEGSSVDGPTALFTIKDAKADLWQQLGNGEIQASGIEGKTGDIVDVPKRDWPRLHLVFSGSADELRWNKEPPRTAYSDPGLEAAAVKKLWPQKTTAKVQTAAAEKRCRDWLISEMRTHPEKGPLGKKDNYLAEAQRAFGMKSERAFNRAWKGALSATGANWHNRKRSGTRKQQST